jgi:hypothetical protein
MPAAKMEEKLARRDYYIVVEDVECHKSPLNSRISQLTENGCCAS